MERRFGNSAEILYYDTTADDVSKDHSRVIGEIENRGLLYPVTVIDGAPVYDGAVSYPAILRTVQQKLERTTESRA